MAASAFDADDDLSVAPAVFEPDHFDGDDAERDHYAPETASPQGPVTADEDQPAAGRTVLFTPSTTPAGGGAHLALKPLEDGRLALLVFTSLELLVSGCGDQQPWVAVSESQLEELFHASGADVVVVDAGLTPEQRWGEGNAPQTVQDFRSVRDVTEQEAR